VQVLQMRHAVMLIGQTGGGKSVILNTLAHAQSRMGHRTHLSILDPKAWSAVHACCPPGMQ